MPHCVKCGSLTSPSKRGRFGVEVKPLAKTSCTYKVQPNRQFYAAAWRIQTGTAIPTFAKLRCFLLSLYRQVNHPLPRSLNTRTNSAASEASATGFTFSFNVAFGMAFLVGSFVVFVVNQRSNKVCIIVRDSA